MKKMLLSLILILILSGYAIPQNIIFEAPETKYRQSDIYPAEFVSSLNKTREQKGGAYKPLKVTADSRSELIFTYDSNWNLSSYSSWDLYSTKRIETSRDIYTYDEKGNIHSHLQKLISGTEPTDYNIKYYTYDGSNRLTMIIDSSRRSTDVQRTLYSYNDKGQLTTVSTQKWLYDAWVDYYRNSYKYDNSGNQVDRVYEEWYITGWVNSFHNISSYDNNNRLITFISQNWKNDQWNNISRKTYTYDSNGNNTVLLNESFSAGAWKNSSRYSYTYDGNGDMTTSKYETWSVSAWNNQKKSEYYYDGSRNCIKVMGFNWGQTDWAPGGVSGTFTYNGGKDEHSFPSGAVINIEYAQTTGVVEEAAITKSFSLQQNYPNPFNSSTTIEYSVMKEGYVKLSVYDALGRLLTTLTDENKPAGNYSVRFNADGYPSGIYFCRLESGGVSLSRKLILLK